MKLKRILIGSILRAIQRHSDSAVVSQIRLVARAVTRASFNASYQFETNGENRVARILLRGVSDNIVFDVGANVGDWSLSISTHLGPGGVIHAFEPSLEVFGKLATKTRHCEEIRCHNFGLSNKDGPLDFLFSRNNSQKSSAETSSAAMLHSKVTDFSQETLQFVRGDNFAKCHKISQIRFLKIDTEGHDLRVLEGFSEMIGRGDIDAIQFEYNSLCIYTKLLLREFYDLLAPAGAASPYVIGRIFPRSVHFKKYETQDENFIDGNFLAVRGALTELIACLQKRSP